MGAAQSDTASASQDTDQTPSHSSANEDTTAVDSQAYRDAPPAQNSVLRDNTDNENEKDDSSLSSHGGCDDSAEFSDASEQLGEVMFQDQLAVREEAVPQSLHSAAVFTGGGSLASNVTASALGGTGREADPSQGSVPPLSSVTSVGRPAETVSVSALPGALHVANCSLSTSSYVSDTATEDWEENEGSMTPSFDLDSTEEDGSEETLLKQPYAGFLTFQECSEQTRVKEQFAGCQRVVPPQQRGPNCAWRKKQQTREQFDQRQRQSGARQLAQEGMSCKPLRVQAHQCRKTQSVVAIGRPLPSDTRALPGQYGGQPEASHSFPELQRQQEQHGSNPPAVFHPSPAFQPLSAPEGYSCSGSVREVPPFPPEPQGPAMVEEVTCPAPHHPPCGWGNTTVDVRGILRDTTPESVQYYFENSFRSGGGKIQRLRWDKTTGLCLLSFECASAAQRVVNHQHVLEGKNLQVSMHEPQSLFHGGREPGGKRAVCVTNFDVTTTTEDALQNHFENPRHGGGEVVEVKIGQCPSETVPRAVVTFRKATDAQNATGKTHQLNGKTLTVALHTPTPTLPFMVSLRDLPPSALAEDVRHFVESVTQRLVYDVIFGTAPGVGLVIFEQNVDFRETQTALASRPFLGALLTAAPVPVTCTVEVHRLPRSLSLSEETLRNYFQNTPRSGGSGVMHVQLLACRETALVTFEDPEVCSTVTSRPHVFHGVSLDVRPHFPCVGPRRGHQPSCPRSSSLPQQQTFSVWRYLTGNKAPSPE